MSNSNGAGSTQGFAYNFISNAASYGNVTWFAGDLQSPADPMSLQQTDIQTLSLRIGHGAAANQTRWLVRVDDSGTDKWFVSLQKYQTAAMTVANFAAQNVGISASFGALTWGALTYDGLINGASTGFAIITDTDPAAVALPSGTVTALGVYNWNGGGNSTRFDNFSITAIPEPGTLLLVGVALGGMLLFRRRR